ncbi:hypothetical protein R3P38DRAFT_1317219 [Favolaschia claudopus]|uniref:F-box domain-containing protein n=1 Tax=Favolaschia claudopus TaxID=2862362 RepID=A0AAW0AWC9_9AGAR
MVLTRSARRAASSLFRLPNEVLTAIVHELSTDDLATVCRTSQLLRNIATPWLYRCVRLTTGSRLRSFAMSLQQSFSALAKLHHLETLTTVELVGLHTVQERHYVDVIATHLPHIHNLELCHWPESGSLISQNEARWIATSLEKFDRLRTLNFGSIKGSSEDDRGLVLQWYAACKTLTSVVLDDRIWRLKNNDWIVVSGDV